MSEANQIEREVGRPVPERGMSESFGSAIQAELDALSHLAMTDPQKANVSLVLLLEVVTGRVPAKAVTAVHWAKLNNGAMRHARKEDR